MSNSNLILGEPKYIPWPALKSNLLGTPEPGPHQPVRFRAVNSRCSSFPTTVLSGAAPFVRAPPLTRESIAPATSGSYHANQQRVTGMHHFPYYRPFTGTVTIGQAQGTPLRIIGRPPRKVGYWQTMWSIEFIGHGELGNLCQRIIHAYDPAYGVLLQEILLLKTRIIREQGRDDSSLPHTYTSTEGTAARHHKCNDALAISSTEELKDVIRGASAQLLSAIDVLSKVLAWVESQEDLLEGWGAANENSRVEVFQNTMALLWMKFSDFWESEIPEELDNRFLPKDSYEQALRDLACGVPISDITAAKLLNTVRGMDFLELIALLFQADCVADTDFMVPCTALARSFTKNGFSMGLNKMYDIASVRLRAIGVEELARGVARTAAAQLKTACYPHEFVNDLASMIYVLGHYDIAQSEEKIMQLLARG